MLLGGSSDDVTSPPSSPINGRRESAPLIDVERGGSSIEQRWDFVIAYPGVFSITNAPT